MGKYADWKRLENLRRSKIWQIKIKWPAIDRKEATEKAKRRWSRLAREDKRNLSTTGLKDTDTTTPQKQENHSGQDTNVTKKNQNLPLPTGPVETCGEVEEKNDNLKKVNQENKS